MIRSVHLISDVPNDYGHHFVKFRVLSSFLNSPLRYVGYLKKRAFAEQTVVGALECSLPLIGCKTRYLE
jgi:hypothetical protein